MWVRLAWDWSTCLPRLLSLDRARDKSAHFLNAGPKGQQSHQRHKSRSRRKACHPFSPADKCARGGTGLHPETQRAPHPKRNRRNENGTRHRISGPTETTEVSCEASCTSEARGLSRQRAARSTAWAKQQFLRTTCPDLNLRIKRGNMLVCKRYAKTASGSDFPECCRSVYLKDGAAGHHVRVMLEHLVARTAPLP